jgi:hypothetical protein
MKVRSRFKTYLFYRLDPRLSQRVLAGWPAVNQDTITFKDTIAPSDITLRRSGDDLLVSINGTSDRLQLANWFSDDARKIERLQFSDSTVWDAALMQQIAGTPTDTDDYLIGTEANDVIDSGGGNDHIDGLGGDDQLLGGPGEDTIYGRAGANAIDGGAGDDTIIANEGTNTIYVNHGGGFDDITSRFILSDVDPDTIAFGPGITPDDLQVQTQFTEDASRVAMDLSIGIGQDEGVLIHAESFFGTALAKDIGSGAGDGVNYNFAHLVNVNVTVFFVANVKGYYQELWKSDGTEAG